MVRDAVSGEKVRMLSECEQTGGNHGVAASGRGNSGCVLRDGDRNTDLCDRAVVSVREIDEDARSVTQQWGHFPKCYHHGNASKNTSCF